ncbi:MAG: hypothetical protein FWF49_06290, partial [Oscillospiraceae bacterium]|nr:hypothetical protein [Oscillospiraceae bacterium]
GGADMERLCAELIEHFRQLMIAKTVKAPGDLLALTPAGVDALTKQAAAVSLPGILYCLDAWQIAYERMRTAASRRVEMELALMRLCAAKGEPPFAAAVAGVSIASHTAVGAVNAPPKTATVKLVPPKDTTDGAAVAAARAEAIESTAPVGSTASSTVPPALSPDETPFAQWPNVLHILSGTCPPLFAVLDASSAVLRGDMVLIQTDNPLFRSLLDADSNKKALSSAVRQATGKDDIRIGARKPAAPPASGEDALTALLRQAREKGVEVKED